MEPSRIEEHLSEIEEQGYTIVRDAIEPPLVDALVQQIRNVEKEMGAKPKGNPAEGYATLRTYNLLARGEVFQTMPVHENVLPIVERVLDTGCLLSGMTAIDIGPGEVCQPIHPDDIVMNVERPHVPLMCTSMWALTDFSDANGGTRAVPGSHRYDHAPDFQAEIETIPIEMPAGSVMIFDASLWHGGGSNRTEDEWRLGVNVQYCAGFIRPQQNQYLGVPREITQTFSDRLLELCGYSLYKGIMGHIDTKSPAMVLGGGRLDQTAYADSRSSDWVEGE
ncbi:phytanoyl-CoA dioxygenase family protein [Myxococcota bacterium]|nr:phytanoyl-CoA dioxygenase family protein [Myxococcota bacterium]